jgi:hypothetical protein
VCVRHRVRGSSAARWSVQPLRPEPGTDRTLAHLGGLLHHDSGSIDVGWWVRRVVLLPERRGCCHSGGTDAGGASLSSVSVVRRASRTTETVTRHATHCLLATPVG